MKARGLAILAVPWQRSIVWLLFLGPFFFLSYGYANHVAASHGVTDSLLFEWERDIPFLPWTILPYWSIDLFYGLSFLLCRNPLEVDRHALRLLTAQLVSVACFLLVPLHFSLERPQVNGFFGTLFDMLMGFDQPYNQAPSLHIGLLVIIWARFATGSAAGWRWLVHGWSALIGLSVLTTYQHHFIDIPTGILVGMLCLWLWPDEGRPTLAERPAGSTAERRRLALRYFVAGIGVALTAQTIGGVGLWLWWGSTALGMVALIHLGPGGAGFQKSQGRHSQAVAALLAPYVLGAWLNSRWWTRRHPQADLVADDVWLGRMPSVRDMKEGGFATLVDLTAELPSPLGDWRYVGLPWLDLVTPEPRALAAAAARIEEARRHGRVLVCCALGYSRSASAVAAWLLTTGRASSLETAEALLRARRSGVVLGESHRDALAGIMAIKGRVSK